MDERPFHGLHSKTALLIFKPQGLSRYGILKDMVSLEDVVSPAAEMNLEHVASLTETAKLTYVLKPEDFVNIEDTLNRKIQ
jgi:hypothetical protein